MNATWQARFRLAALWLSATSRIVADWTLRLTALFELSDRTSAPAAASVSGWHEATLLAIFPFVLLAPFNGIVSNALPRQKVLRAAAALTLLGMVAAGLLLQRWSVVLAVVAIASAVYSPARFALLPAAARDSHIPLPRVNGLFEAGAAAGIVAGIVLGLHLQTIFRPGSPFGELAFMYLFSLLTALPVRFPSDVIRPEPWRQAVGGFFRDVGRILREKAAAGSLLGLAVFQAIVTAGSGVLVGQALASGEAVGTLLKALVFVGSGAAAGGALASWQGNSRRSLGLVPVGAAGLLLALAWGAIALTGARALVPVGACVLLGFMAGLVNVPLRAAYMADVPADARGNAMSIMNTSIYVFIVVLALLMLALAVWLPGPLAQVGVLAGITALGAILAWRWLLRNAIEQAMEIALAPIYRIRSCGPGADRVTERGPLLIVANHSSYMDPIWIGKVVPRQLTPMMTSLFYDLPGIRWLMVHIVGAIRVPVTSFRREAPELAQAVAVLKAGGCVLIFPEGGLRRSEEQLLRPFGQGAWHVLRELPDTPVQVCWIEGGWGSYMSYYNGAPMQNKRFDFWRRIRIGMAEPAPLDPDVLVDHRTTRTYLARAVLNCRRFLDLPVPDHVHASVGEAPA